MTIVTSKLNHRGFYHEDIDHRVSRSVQRRVEALESLVHDHTHQAAYQTWTMRILRMLP